MENVKVKDRFVDEKTGIEYIKQGDYYLPNLVLGSEDTNYKIETGDTLSIDSENRSVWLYKSKTSGTGRLITKYVDYSSTWFSVKGAFNFKSNDCNINSVSFYERGG